MTNPATNGALTPPATTDKSSAPPTSSAKRKRSESDDGGQVNGTEVAMNGDEPAASTSHLSKERPTQEIVEEVFEILSR